MRNFGVSRVIEVEYDGRFDHEEHCIQSHWQCDSSRVGERWRFQFPNGKVISVIRTTSWNYEFVKESLSTACSIGFGVGLYEASEVSVDPDWGEVFGEVEGYLTFKEVKELLDKVENS